MSERRPHIRTSAVPGSLTATNPDARWTDCLYPLTLKPNRRTHFMHSNVSTPRGESRLEKYTPSKSENFGLNKRTRRLAKGILTSKPDGTVDPEVKKALSR